MSKYYTSKNQSEILIKLGIPIDTADMWYGVTYKKIGREDDDFGESIEYTELSKYPAIKENAYTKKGIPAWSLSALIDLMPDKILINNESYYLSFTKERVSFRGPVTWDGQKAKSFEMDNIFDAVFEMVCWLKENGKL